MKKKVMGGWKTWTGILGLIAVYLATNIFGVDMAAAGDTANVLTTLLEAAFAATTVVGIGSKIEKSGVGVPPAIDGQFVGDSFDEGGAVPGSEKKRE